jgi:large subunit ribosomal protein L18
MSRINSQIERRKWRHARVRARVASGTAERPRLCVFRSNKYLTGALVDDTKGITIASINTKVVKVTKKADAPFTKVNASFEAGRELAKLAKAKGVETVVFDRGGYRFAGRIKALADGARDGGLKF